MKAAYADHGLDVVVSDYTCVLMRDPTTAARM